MEYKWFEIREKIIKACKKTFAEQGLSMGTLEIEAATDLFDKVVSYPLQYPLVGNLQGDLQQSLQRAFIDNVGTTADLRNVLNLMDAYMKKLLVMARLKTPKQLMQSRNNLKFLLQHTGASNTFCQIKETIRESDIARYNQDPTGAYILCVAYLGRNKVHDSPEWDAEDVYHQLRYAMATYILVTGHLAPRIKSNYPKIGNSGIRIDLSEINETGYVYDFINYGNTSNKIKNRIVESFILNHVYRKNGEASVDKLVKEVVAFSRQSLTDGSIRGLIGRMIPSKMKYVNSYKRDVILVEEEKTRIRTALESYELMVNRLLAEIENLLDEYGLKNKTQAVYDRLKLFFESNCLSIIKLMGEQDGEPSLARTDEYINDFVQFLKDIGCPDTRCDELFSGLLRICQLNDVLVKIALGKNFTNISNPDTFSSGLRLREKKVYLDTQLLLYALCDYDDFSQFSGSPSFMIVKSLLGTARQNPNIRLATISEYVDEAAYHLKRAVQLIPFDDIYYESRIKLSDNVFYSYYYYLKDNGLLNEGVETLSDFLMELFDVDYDDIKQGNFEQKFFSYITDLLENDFGIEVESTAYFGAAEVNNSEKVFNTALMSRGDTRSNIAARRDAFMGLHLFGGGHKGDPEPFFLSWDRTFYFYRKDYIRKYVKTTGASWHLFSPARFVNHLNLLDMRIDVDVMTEDLISIIEDDDTARNTKHVLDSVRKLLERSNVSTRQKRKVYSKIIFTETEFPNDTDLPDESRLKLTSDFATAFDRMLTMMQSGRFKMDEFTGIIGVEERFKGIVSVMKRRLLEESIERCAIDTYRELEEEVEAKLMAEHHG